MSALALTSGTLIGLAAVASGALIVITLATWRRAGLPGTRHVLARFGLLLANNIAVTALIFLAVNRVFGFYASWAELLGTSTSTGVVRAAPGQTASPPAAGGGADGSQSGPPGPLQSGAPQPDGQASAAGGFVQVLGTQRPVSADGGQQGAGELQSVRVYGERSGLSAHGYVYLPPQYPGAGHQFAVVVVISDSIAGSGTAGGTANAAGAAQAFAVTAYREVAAGRAAPAVYIMLPATIAPGDQACLDVPAGPQAGTFFSQDLPAVLRASYRVSSGPAGWGLLGDSSGGYCAVRLAMTSSDRFAVAAAPAGDYQVPPGTPQVPGTTATPHGAGTGSVTHQARRTPVPWLFGGSPLLRDEANLVWRLRMRPPQPVTVVFTGANSADLGQARTFISAVRPPMKARTMTLAPPSASAASSASSTAAQPLGPVIGRVSRELSAWG